MYSSSLLAHSQSLSLSSCSTVTASGTHRMPYDRLVVVMVGLPARGKTYIAHRIARYLNWLGVHTRVFNVGEYRRVLCGAELQHSFFDSCNTEAEMLRTRSAVAALTDMLTWLSDGHGEVGIYDATNSTSDRRKMLREHCERQGMHLLFIESICTLEDVVRANIVQVKQRSPDYAHATSIEAVLDDFTQRIRHYEEVYQSLGVASDEAQCSYVKLVNTGERAIVNRIASYRQSQIVYFAMNLHIRPHRIYIVRHGETEYNEAGRIGGDSSLSSRGWEFARKLPELLQKVHVAEGGGQEKPSQLTVWTSSMRRTIETASFVPYPKLQWRALNEIDAGVCEGLTYEEIAKRYPLEFAARDGDKFRFRYRNGESYADLVARLEPIIIEAERMESVLIVGHQAVLRAILAYFLNRSHEELPYIRVPLHTLICLTPRAYGCDVQFHHTDIEAVNTHRDRPL